MIDIISDKDLRALIKLSNLECNAAHFSAWNIEDQDFILCEVFDSLCNEDKRALLQESIDVYFNDDADAGYWTLVNSSSALPSHMELLLEAQINKAMRDLKQIRDEENRG